MGFPWGPLAARSKIFFATLLDGGNDKVYRQKKLPIRRNVAGLVILVQLYTKLLYKIVRRSEQAATLFCILAPIFS
jgi:hypothetical protein